MHGVIFIKLKIIVTWTKLGSCPRWPRPSFHISFYCIQSQVNWLCWGLAGWKSVLIGKAMLFWCRSVNCILSETVTHNSTHKPNHGSSSWLRIRKTSLDPTFVFIDYDFNLLHFIEKIVYTLKTSCTVKQKSQYFKIRLILNKMNENREYPKSVIIVTKRTEAGIHGDRVYGICGNFEMWCHTQCRYILVNLITKFFFFFWW